MDELLDSLRIKKRIKKSYNDRLNKEIKKVKDSIIEKGCPHPEDFLNDYHWEWDNGYGRQEQRVGKRCSICEKIDSSNSGRWYNLSDYDF